MTDDIEEIHESDDDLTFADPFSGEPDIIPEFFKERRNYVS